MSVASQFFNADQLDYMDSLARQPDADICWCGWYTTRECHAGWGPCSIGARGPILATLADRRPVQCPDARCRNYPDRPGETIRTHNAACRRDHGEAGARNLADAYRPEGLP